MDADFCIVGAGPAGLTLAHALLGSGRSVVLLESGAGGAAPGLQDPNSAILVGGDYGDPRTMRRRQVGGTANLWNTEVASQRAAKYVPLDAQDLAPRAPRAAHGWPFGMDELAPYYRQAQALCGLGRFDYEADGWADAQRPVLPLDRGLAVSRIYQFGAADVFLQRIPARLEAAADTTLVTSATVWRVETDRHGERVVAVHVAAPNGRRAAVRARHVVLAAGAIENARLLLATDEVFPEGLGNRHDQVGRCFMEHPRDYALTLQPADGALWARAGFYDQHLTVDGTVVMGRLALPDAVLESERLLQASATLLPVYPQHGWFASLLRLVGKARQGYPRGGAGWSEHATPPQAFRLLLNLEQAPWPDNRVQLAAERDPLGVPLARVAWRWRAEEQAALRRVRQVFRQALESAGLGRVTESAEARPDPNAHHHAGTTRMSADPRCGVVDAQGRVHGVENLFVLGASTFPCAGFANPMLSIVALSLRLARHLKDVAAA